MKYPRFILPEVSRFVTMGDEADTPRCRQTVMGLAMGAFHQCRRSAQYWDGSKHAFCFQHTREGDLPIQTPIQTLRGTP